MKQKLLAIVLICLLFAFLAGCQAVAEKAVEKGIEKSTGVKVDADEEKATIKTEEGEAEVDTGKDVELPEGYPSDMPVYDNARLMNSVKSTVEGKTSYTATYESEEGIKEVFAFFKLELPKNGYEITASLEMGETATIAIKKNGKDGGGIMFAWDKDKKVTTYIVTVM